MHDSCLTEWDFRASTGRRATRAAIKVFVLVFGTTAENIRMTAPIREISGATDRVGRVGPE
jgi:hypothetical protein